jgi:hypothetical protein
MLLEGSIGIAGTKTRDAGYYSTETGGHPVLTFGVGVLPVLSYSISNRLSIEAICDFLSFGFQTTSVKDKEDSSLKATTYNVGFGVNSNAINLSSYNITMSNTLKVGIIYKF